MDKMGPPITVPVEGRRMDIPPNLTSAQSIDWVEDNCSMNVDPKWAGEGRGAIDELMEPDSY